MKYMVLIGSFLLLLGCSSPSGMPYKVTFTSEGLGAIKATTLFDTAKIAALLPGFEAKLFSRFEAGRTYSLIRLQRGGKVLCDCYPDASGKYIGRIESVLEEVQTARGAHVGAQLQKATCKEQLNTGEVLCALEPHLYAEIDETQHIVRLVWYATTINF
jgi:hypothetical protein